MKDIRELFNEKKVNLPVVAVTGGKGGTGKTTVAVNLAAALAEMKYQVLLVDTDVDSPTTSIVLGVVPQPFTIVETFIPKIAEAKCIKCRRCAQVCRPHALIQIRDRYPMFFEELCSSCEACRIVCPTEAITGSKKILGTVNKTTRGRITFIGGELKAGEARSADVVVATKQIAFQEAQSSRYDLMIVDTAPGTHCNVVQSLRAADLAIAVTEPTPLGIYDLELILRLTREIGIMTNVVINKSTLAGGDIQEVRKTAAKHISEVLGEIPMDEQLFKAYVNAEPLVKAYPDSPAALALAKIAELISKRMKLHVSGDEPTQDP